jgi:hypothetical protein
MLNPLTNFIKPKDRQAMKAAADIAGREEIPMSDRRECKARSSCSFIRQRASVAGEEF